MRLPETSEASIYPIAPTTTPSRATQSQKAISASPFGIPIIIPSRTMLLQIIRIEASLYGVLRTTSSMAIPLPPTTMAASISRNPPATQLRATSSRATRTPQANTTAVFFLDTPAAIQSRPMLSRATLPPESTSRAQMATPYRATPPPATATA